MRKITFTLLLILPLAELAHAQLTQTLRGRVVDKESKFPLTGVTVLVDNSTSLGTVTDTEGVFTIAAVPVGRHEVKFSLVGYKDVLLNNIVIDAGRETILNAEMEESITQLEAVTVRARRSGEASNEMALVSARQFSVEETERYAGSRGEPARMASNFAGVQGADDSRNDIVIRGNSPAGVLWRLEGVSIPNPNHFAIPGTSGGPVSIINNRYLANSDFFTGAFPAEFANSIAGAFDLKLRNGNNQKHEFMGQFGFLGTEAMAEGPISKKAGSSYLASYRYANLGLFSKLGLDIGTQAIPSYQDGFFRLNFPTKNGGNVALWGLGGTSTVDILISEQQADDRNIFGQNDRDQYYTSKMGVMGLTYNQPLNKSTFFRATLATSTTIQDANHDYLFLDKDNEGRPRVENERFVINGKTPILDYRFSETRVSAVASLNHKFSVRSTLKVGINTDLFNFKAFDSTRVFTDAANTQLGAWRSRWDANETFVQLQPYVQWKYFLSDKLTLSLGASSLYNSINTNSFSPIEPRAGLAWDLPNRQKLTFATGLHSQLMPTYTYFYGENLSASPGTSDLLNRDVWLTKSWHWVTGYSRLLARNMRFLAEVYYQHLFNVPVEAAPGSSFTILNSGSAFSRIFPGKLVNEGIGRNYGVEFTLEKFFSNSYYFLVTTSLFDSKYQANDGVWRNTDFNGRYAFNALFSKEFKIRERSRFNIGAKFTAIGGRWYGPVNAEASRAQQEVIFQDAGRNTLQFAPYRRFDIKTEYKINRAGLTHTIAVDLVNVLGIQNQLSLSYAPQPDGSFIKQEYQLGFLPVFYYRIDF
ncbi:MAG: TonB-dependent receptor [Bacteroidetes bacterium]|nr:TonB-dependent receptor [Bacteroidota bacterium]